jgi:hypothetical protein
MKNQIWMYILIGILALGIGFFIGKKMKSKESKEEIGTGATKKIKDKDGKIKNVPLSYELKEGEEELPKTNV